jgi:hypothetical protein
LGTGGGIGGMPGVFCAEALPLSARSMLVAATTRRMNLNFMILSPLLPNNRSVQCIECLGRLRGHIGNSHSTP